MANLKVFLTTVCLLCIYAHSDLAIADVYLTSYTQYAKFSTGPRRVSGIWGRLAGHYSKSDQNRLVAGTEAHFARIYPKQAGWLQLPVQIDYRGISASAPVSLQSEGFFGRTRTDTYQSFGGAAEVTIPILSAGPKPADFAPPRLIERASLGVYFGHGIVGRIRLSDPSILLTDIKIENEEDAQTKITLSSSLRIALYDQLKSLRDIHPEDTIFLKAELEMADHEIIHLNLKTWDEWEQGSFARLFFLSKLRFANPKFYASLCSYLLGSRP